MRLSRLLPAIAMVSLALLALGGCGKKGALIPPEALVPAPISNLALAQKGNYFQVSWSAPARQEGGARLSDLAGFVLFRRVLLPVDIDCDECPGAYAQLARIDLDYLQQARRIGNLLLFDDYGLKLGESYQYKVRSFTREGAQSRDSNRAHRSAVAPPLPPVLEAHPSTTGIELKFVALPPEEGKLLGYNIYRSKNGEAMPLAPLNPELVAGNSYEDKQLLIRVRYGYSVRAVALSPKGETVESAPSNLAEGELLEPG